MPTRAEVVAEARLWLGTPYHHQAAVQGVGCDCIGLIRGVCQRLGTVPLDVMALPGVDRFTGYGVLPNGRKMREACDLYMRAIETSSVQPGDVLLLRFQLDPQHMAIVGDYLHGGLSIIHALGTVDGKGKVIEQRLSTETLRRLVQAYAMPGITEEVA